MTSEEGQDHEHLFLADVYPELGEYLAGQCATRYDAHTGRARFRAWLLAHAQERALAEADEIKAAPEEILVLGDDDDEDLPADQARTIRIPVHMVEVINKLARVQRQMLQDLGREPTPDELAVELDMTPEKVIEVQKYGREPISLHTPLGEDGDSEFGDLIEGSEAIQPGEAVSFTLLQEQLHWVLDTLSEQEAGVISMRFGLTDGQLKTLDEIGKVYGVTRERIRQIESKTMSKLRRPGPGINDKEHGDTGRPHKL